MLICDCQIFLCGTYMYVACLLINLKWLGIRQIELNSIKDHWQNL